MNDIEFPLAIFASDVNPRRTPSNYPPVFAKKLNGRIKRQLGAAFGLNNFGVNLTELNAGAISALRHAHKTQDEFIYILQGYPVLRTNYGDTRLEPGMCAGFRAGSDDAHQIINLTETTVVYLEIGDRSLGDVVSYPDDDLVAEFKMDKWIFFHKDGRLY